MSKTLSSRYLAMAGFATLLMMGTQPARASDYATAASTADTGVIELRTGDQAVRRFRLDESRVVQFPARNSPGSIQLRSASQTERKQLKALRQAGYDSRSVKTRAPNGDTVSPVLTDASGKPWALPGGLIVSFRDEVSEALARAQLQAAGLVPESRITPRVWLVKSPAGLAGIEMANALNAKGQFADVSPNWWTPRTRK